MKYLIVLFVVLAIGAGVLINQRHTLVIAMMSTGESPPLLDAQDEGPNVRWVDDYFTVQQLDANTFAVGEPRYAQQNYSYLIVGDDRAVLFDAGPGIRDIRAVAESLTDLPITFVPSHFHYDHTGNTVTFDRVAVVDLPYIRARAVDGMLQLTNFEHLGGAEGIAIPTLKVDEWLTPDSVMELGGRGLRVLYTPGHTRDSISLLDVDNGILFSGDFIYPGPLFAFLPNSDMGEYLAGVRRVLAQTDDAVRIYAAHRMHPPGAPLLQRTDVEDLQAVLEAVRDGEAQATGIYPREYPVNENMTLLTEPGWLQNWEAAL